MTTETQATWIVSVAVQERSKVDEMRDWLEETCDASPVEIEMAEQSVTWLEAYCSEETTASLLAASIQTTFPGAEPLVRGCAAKDWSTFWRHHFKVQTIGKRFMVVPEWLREETDTGDRIPLWINPGLSFGTGDHFTTRYCLEAIGRLDDEGFKPAQFLDAGCGSAILSVAAHKLGWENVLAVDHDELALGAASENLTLNGVREGVTLQTMDLTREWPEGRFELVVANLYGGLLMELAPRLVRCCSGVLVLSGIRTIEAEAVSTLFSQLGVREIGAESDPEWSGLTFEIPPDA